MKMKNFDQINYFRMRDIIIDKKKWVNQNIDKTIFNELKQNEYSKVIDEDDSHLLFKDRLSHENYGKFNDIDIDEQVFDNFNNRYDHLKKIVDNQENYDEDNMVDYFKKYFGR